MSRRPQSQIYPRHRLIDLEPHYSKHIGAMTELPGIQEGLHNKSDIAEQLAWRDQKIEGQESELALIRTVCMAAGLVDPGPNTVDRTLAMVGELLPMAVLKMRNETLERLDRVVLDAASEFHAAPDTDEGSESRLLDAVNTRLHYIAHMKKSVNEAAK